MNKERLLRVADHLEKGQLIHKIFDFNRLNVNCDPNGLIAWVPTTETNRCGTNGCAIGELPAIFSEWEFRRPCEPIKGRDFIDFSPLLITDSSNKSFDDASKFFDITPAECDLLFMPSEIYLDEQERDDAGDEYRPDGDSLVINNVIMYRKFSDATKEEVAKQIRDFVNLKEKCLSSQI